MKKYAVPVAMLFLCGLLFLFSDQAVAAARSGFALWCDSVLPALLPFFICTYILQNCGVLTGNASLIFLSMVSGAPSGARLLSYRKNYCYSSESAAALSVIGPMFIFASFCRNMLSQPALAYPLILSQGIASALVLLLYPLKPAIRSAVLDPTDSFGTVLVDGIKSGMQAMLNIGASIIFFTTVISVSENITAFVLQPFCLLVEKMGLNPILPQVLAKGIIEMVSGCSALVEAGLSLRCTSAVAAFFFAFGGICIMIQSMTFLKISPAKYLKVKLIQGSAAALIAFLLTPLFVRDPSSPVFASIPAAQMAANTISVFALLAACAIGISVILLMGAVAHKRKL